MWVLRLVACLIVVSLLVVVPISSGDDEPLSCGDVVCDHLVPDLVTGHTVYAQIQVGPQVPNSLPLGAPVPDTEAQSAEGLFRLDADDPPARVLQVSCVTWFNGKNLDQRPPGDHFGWGSERAFPSDEDEPDRGTYDPAGGGDRARQDYDMDRFVDTCVPVIGNDHPSDLWVGLPTDFAGVAGLVYSATSNETPGAFVTLVERGDCAPQDGSAFRFRGHLDFVDPRDIYHEVQEYDYVCGTTQAADGAKAAFPLTGTDPHNLVGCREYRTPATTADPTSGDLGYFDFGHKCNGSIQDLFTERMWITQLHDTVYDRIADAEYNFALVADTCAGVSIFEGPPLLDQGGGMRAEGQQDDYGDAWSAPAWMPAVTTLDDALAKAGLRVKGTDVCMDGSSFSFDDTTRDHVTHRGPPAREEDIHEGNSYDYNSTSSTFGKHRQNCRHDFLYWHQGLPRDSGAIGKDCYEEHHRSVAVDLHHHATDPTGGLWSWYSNGLTGLSAYVEGESTWHRYSPEVSE